MQDLMIQVEGLAVLRLITTAPDGMILHIFLTAVVVHIFLHGWYRGSL